IFLRPLCLRPIFFRQCGFRVSNIRLRTINTSSQYPIGPDLQLFRQVTQHVQEGRVAVKDESGEHTYKTLLEHACQLWSLMSEGRSATLRMRFLIAYSN